MDYYFSEKDPSGYVHSIDNLILTYYVENVGLKCIRDMIRDLQDMKDRYPGIHYWEKLDILPCSKYSYYQNAVHLDDGIYLLLGHYIDFDRDTKKSTVFPMIRLEVNPNKHADKPILKEVLSWINQRCYDCVLTRYDYAVDIPVTPDKVHVFGTNKEKGLYKGTRYFGQRNKNGFCRIYDKQKEQHLDSPMTRVEHVISRVKTTKALSFEKVYIEDPDSRMEELSKTDSVIVELCSMLQSNGIDFEDVLKKLDKRKRKTIVSHLHGNGYRLLEFDKGIHDGLLDLVIRKFGITERDVIDHNAAGFLPVDEDGFIKMEDCNLELPFD